MGVTRVVPSIVLVAILLIAAVLVRRFRARPGSAQRDAESEARRTGRFQAVSIRSADDGCTAAHALRGRRFLAAAAPRLPLPNCDAPRCLCHYMHHGDRRDGADRRSPFQGGFGGSAARVARDQRRREDRRSDDARPGNAQ